MKIRFCLFLLLIAVAVSCKRGSLKSGNTRESLACDNYLKVSGNGNASMLIDEDTTKIKKGTIPDIQSLLLFEQSIANKIDAYLLFVECSDSSYFRVFLTKPDGRWTFVKYYQFDLTEKLIASYYKETPENEVFLTENLSENSSKESNPVEDIFIDNISAW